MESPDDAGYVEEFFLSVNHHAYGTGMIYCRNKEKGCEWIGEINDLENHLEKTDGCQHEKVCCPDCNTELERHCLINHVKNECPLQVIDCRFCFAMGRRQFIEGPQHKVDCFVPCPNKCGTKRISCEDIDEHNKICPTAIVRCDYHAMGCECSMIRKDMEAHSKENVHDHLQLTRKYLDEFTQEYVNFLNSMMKPKKQLETLRGKCSKSL